MYQVVEMSHEEKMEMYMKMSKKKLAEMLIQANLILSSIRSEPAVYGQSVGIMDVNPVYNATIITTDINPHHA